MARTIDFQAARIQANHSFVRHWKSPEGWNVDLHETWNGDGRGGTYLAYIFRDGDRVIFAGSDFSPGPGINHASDAAVGGLLAFLSLRPGDTDPEYFDSYTPEQLEWAQANGEMLGVYAHDLEENSA